MISDIIEALRVESSTKKKEEILRGHSGNSTLRGVFFHTENPRLNYYLRFDPKEITPSGDKELTEESLSIFSEINARLVTGGAARSRFMNVLSEHNPESQAILVKILNRDLRCNVGTSICNKVWKDLIPEMPCMLASKGDAKALSSIKPKKDGYIVGLKADGGRLMIAVDAAGKVTCYSRNGSTLNLHGALDSTFSKFPGLVFDGEIVTKTDGKFDSRKESNGFYTKAVRGTITKEESDRFFYLVWDCVDFTDFFAGYSPTPYGDRLKKLGSLDLGAKAAQIECEVASDLDACMEFYDRMLARGEEGAIIKFADMPFEDRRSKKMIKLKQELTSDLLVVGFEEGGGKYEGMLGNLICETSDGKLRVNVGSGFVDEQRVDWKQYEGRIVEVAYNAIIESKGRDQKSLFLPIFKGIRYDKTTANSLGELQ